MFVRGALIAYGIAIWETVLMELVPENRLSRVISLDFFGSLGLTPIGYALAAVLAGVLRAGVDHHRGRLDRVRPVAGPALAA